MKTYKFGICETPRGAVIAWMQPPRGRKQEKRFRAGATISAQSWIDAQIGVLAECREINPHTDDYTVVETHKTQD